MAHHPPSPSGGNSSRRLSELLGEQQEPFSLDLYLLEKGCSPAFLDAAAGGACSTCWPRAGSAGGRALWRRTAKSKKQQGGVLRLLFSKIVLRGKTAAAPPAAAAKMKRLQPAAIDWRRDDADADADEKQSTTGRFTNAGPASRAGEAQHTEDEEEQEEEEDDEDDTSSSNSKKQLSPVSVLEQRQFEHERSPPPHAQKAMAIFRELLQAAYTPTLLDLLASNAKAISGGGGGGGNTTTSKGGGSPCAAATSSPAARRKKKTNSRARSSSSSDTFDEDLARVAALVASEMPAAAVRPEDAREERREVGDAVAAAVLEALAEETAAALMGMDVDHDCAVDAARWRTAR